MSDHRPASSSCPTTYRLLQGFGASIDDGALRQRPSGQPEWHMYDDHAVHLASFTGDSTDAIRGAMRLVMDRETSALVTGFSWPPVSTSSDLTMSASHSERKRYVGAREWITVVSDPDLAAHIYPTGARRGG
jgi:hypothetical protein